MSTKMNDNSIAHRFGSAFASPRMRFVVLAFFCFMTFGSYWCFDIPAALKPDFVKRYDGGDPDHAPHYGLLYALYNFLNMGIVLAGGLFIDVIGLRLGSVLFCALILIGQFVLAVGTSYDNFTTGYAIVLVGRIIFSLGGESLSVAQSCFCSKWFKGKELALSFGITLSFSRIGSTGTLLFTPRIGQSYGFSAAVWVSVIMCLISLVMTILACIADRGRDIVIKSETVSAGAPFKISDVKHFPASLWLLYLVCACYYIGVFTFVSVSGQTYLAANFGYADTDPTLQTLLSIPYFMSAFLAPLIGFGVDRVGKKPFFMIVSCGILVAGYAVLLYVPNPGSSAHIVPPIIAMSLFGLSYSLLASCLWPCVPLIVKEQYVGTAYAIMNAIQNAGVGAVTAVLSFLPQTSKACLYFQVSFVIAGLVTAVFLMLYDVSHGSPLTSKSSAAQAAGPKETDPLINK